MTSSGRSRRKISRAYVQSCGTCCNGGYAKEARVARKLMLWVEMVVGAVAALLDDSSRMPAGRGRERG
jgi:hypothetical protein